MRICDAIESILAENVETFECKMQPYIELMPNLVVNRR
jgi:hypothetical protein